VTRPRQSHYLGVEELPVELSVWLLVLESFLCLCFFFPDPLSDVPVLVLEAPLASVPEPDWPLDIEPPLEPDWPLPLAPDWPLPLDIEPPLEPDWPPLDIEPLEPLPELPV
jgi:hypothetical protein